MYDMYSQVYTIYNRNMYYGGKGVMENRGHRKVKTQGLCKDW